MLVPWRVYLFFGVTAVLRDLPFFLVHCVDWQYNDKIIPSDFVVGEVGLYNLTRPVVSC